MGDHYAILALRRKRARLAGEIEAIEWAQVARRASLANLDAAILLFENAGDPTLIRAIRPVRRGKWFRHSEQTRLTLEALRDATEPMTVREFMDYAALSKGLDARDTTFGRMLERQTRQVLTALTRRGLAFRFETKPITWSREPVRAGG